MERSVANRARRASCFSIAGEFFRWLYGLFDMREVQKSVRNLVNYSLSCYTVLEVAEA